VFEFLREPVEPLRAGNVEDEWKGARPLATAIALMTQAREAVVLAREHATGDDVARVSVERVRILRHRGILFAAPFPDPVSTGPRS
jgi:hypothetical protein